MEFVYSLLQLVFQLASSLFNIFVYETNAIICKIAIIFEKHFTVALDVELDKKFITSNLQIYVITFYSNS